MGLKHLAGFDHGIAPLPGGYKSVKSRWLREFEKEQKAQEEAERLAAQQKKEVQEQATQAGENQIEKAACIEQDDVKLGKETEQDAEKDRPCKEDPVCSKPSQKEAPQRAEQPQLKEQPPQREPPGPREHQDETKPHTSGKPLPSRKTDLLEPFSSGNLKDADMHDLLGDATVLQRRVVSSTSHRKDDGKKTSLLAKEQLMKTARSQQPQASNHEPQKTVLADKDRPVEKDRDGQRGQHVEKVARSKSAKQHRAMKHHRVALTSSEEDSTSNSEQDETPKPAKKYRHRPEAKGSPDDDVYRKDLSSVVQTTGDPKHGDQAVSTRPKQEHPDAAHYQNSKASTQVQQDQTEEHTDACGRAVTSNPEVSGFVPVEYLAHGCKDPEPLGEVYLAVCKNFNQLWQTVRQRFGDRFQDDSTVRLVYKDGDGDWLLLQADDPWPLVLSSAQKLLLTSK